MSISKTTPLNQFELPAPETFQPTTLRELPLSEQEQVSVLTLARQQKYDQAYARWYKWETSRPLEPRSYTAGQMREWFEREAQRRMGRPFVVDAANEYVLELLCYYFAEDPAFEAATDAQDQLRGYSLRKGLLLRGGVGCGKTTLLTIFSHNPRLPFLMKPCRELVGEYAEQGTPGEQAGGEQALRPYCQLIPLARSDAKHFNYRTHAGLALDDIGTEDWKAKHYGRQLNVVEHIISSRDDQVVAGSLPRWATHGTTNLPFDDFEGVVGMGTIYGARWRSRMRGLVNLIDFPKTAPDRRN